jgi:hypothetical protein
MISRLRKWWQLRTGEFETPFDDDVSAWGISILVHLAILVAIAVVMLPPEKKPRTLMLTAPMEDTALEEVDPSEFEYSEVTMEDAGANSVADEAEALSQAEMLADISEVAAPELDLMSDPIAADFNPLTEVSLGLTLNDRLNIKGTVGVGTTGASGAVDRLTQEIALSLEERPTLVMWLFDQSASLTRQREEIHDRFARIYSELNAVVSQRKARAGQPPLVTSIVAFGKTVNELTSKPTDDVDELKRILTEVQRDDSGVENVFTAIYGMATKYRKLRTSRARNVMFIVVTDESGDDQTKLDACVNLCRSHEMPVYVVGVPAPFGRLKAAVKWVDPDPEYDQTPQRGLVDQGPESLFPERIKLRFSGLMDDDPLIDSGFGPYALTRLCYETGGIYFAVHPNRRLGRRIRDRQTSAFASFMKQFFDPAVMRRYRPDYVSRTEYLKRLDAVKSRKALVQAAKTSWSTSIESPRLRFGGRDEAELVRQLTEAQKAAAVLEPTLRRLHELLKQGESDREKEDVLRWQAGYDLAMGRALAGRVRTEAYNAMLAQAKRGMKFKNDRNNTWILSPSDSLDLGSQLTKNAKRATEYLHRVVEDHPETPWAYLASMELKHPIGWEWREDFTPMQPRRQGNGNNNNRMRRDDQARMLNRPKPKRPLPKL